MSTSYQDIDTRLKRIEDMVLFTMQTIQLQKREASFLDPTHPIITQTNLFELYRQAQAVQGQLVRVTDPEPASTEST